MGVLNDTRTQLFHRPDYPVADSSGKIVIVTGSNAGFRKEAVKHFVRLKAEKVSIAVRSLAKGEAASAEVESESGRTGCIEVWELDWSHCASGKVFAKRAASFDCFDAAVLNARIATKKYEILKKNITVNLISPEFRHKRQL